MSKYINVLVMLLLTLFCVSCNTKKGIAFNTAVIDNIVEESDSLPSQYSGILFFCKCHENEILSLDVKELKEIYLNESSGFDYYIFLTDLLNQKKNIQCGNTNKKFKINEEVSRQYKKMSLEEFISFYCTSNENNTYYLRKNIPENQRNTVFYYLFTNNFLTSFDDYIGIFIIKKV